MEAKNWNVKIGGKAEWTKKGKIWRRWKGFDDVRWKKKKKRRNLFTYDNEKKTGINNKGKKILSYRKWKANIRKIYGIKEGFLRNKEKNEKKRERKKEIEWEKEKIRNERW